MNRFTGTGGAPMASGDQVATGGAPKADAGTGGSSHGTGGSFQTGGAPATDGALSTGGRSVPEVRDDSPFSLPSTSQLTYTGPAAREFIFDDGKSQRRVVMNPGDVIDVAQLFSFAGQAKRHRWCPGSRTCDNCGRDYDWGSEPCGEPLPTGDMRRSPQRSPTCLECGHVLTETDRLAPVCPYCGVA